MLKIVFLLYGVHIIALCVRAAPTQKRSITSDASQTSQQASESPKTTEELAKYFAKYSQFVRDISSEEVSSDGNGGGHVELPQIPSFVERVIELQEYMGLETTGDPDENLIERIEVSRCGISDPPSDPNAPGAYTVKAMWESKYLPEHHIYPLTFSFVEKQNLPDTMTYEAVEEGILSAMCLWEVNSNLRFRNIGDEQSVADITISFQESDHGDFYAFDGKGGTLAHAFYPENGRLHFDKQEAWYLAKKGAEDYRKKDVFTVAAHEFGHNIGLMHSKNSKALMAPIYRYSGTFEEYELPTDDIEGVENMYGQRVDANPVDEAGTACRELYEKYQVTTKDLKQPVKQEPITRVKAVVVCNDDEKFGKYCPNWKRAGYCENPLHAKTLHRRCKSTCGFCPGPLPEHKPSDDEEVSKLHSSVCGISKFDSVSVVFDGRNYLDMYYFKDDYYFESSIKLESDASRSYSLLNDSSILSGALTWRTDPKTIKSGSYKYKQPDLFDQSKGMSALIPAKKWYLTFEDNGRVQQYSRGTPTTPHVASYSIESLFPEYPYQTVDAAFVEFDVGPNKDTIYSLFHKNKIWQYQEDANIMKNVTAIQQQMLKFFPFPSMNGVDIQEWHGVPACDVDSVFSYNGIPYFLKGNTFWPAVETEPIVPRDITYNFLRCWQEEPLLKDIPTACDAVSAGQNADGNRAPGFELPNLMIMGLFSLCSFTFSRF